MYSHILAWNPASPYGPREVGSHRIFGVAIERITIQRAELVVCKTISYINVKVNNNNNNKEIHFASNLTVVL